MTDLVLVAVVVGVVAAGAGLLAGFRKVLAAAAVFVIVVALVILGGQFILGGPVDAGSVLPTLADVAAWIVVGVQQALGFIYNLLTQ